MKHKLKQFNFFKTDKFKLFLFVEKLYKILLTKF